MSQTGRRLRTVRTMCPMNCHPTLCGMLADIEEAGGPARLAGVRGDPDNPDSRGFLCQRGHAAREIIGNPQRLLRPQRRVPRSGSWQAIGWDDALDTIVATARRVGPAAVALWPGHGMAAGTYGTRLHGELVRRFASVAGWQSWSPAMLCWGLGGFGFGLTGVLRVHTKEDLGESAALVVLWGANLASQPNTGRHVARARRRGAGVCTIDVRRTEAAALSDEVILVRPGTDAALALALMHVIVDEGLDDRAFVARHTVGFDELRLHLRAHDPRWAAPITGVPADRIVALARRYAGTRPAMIVAGGSSMHKGAHGWQPGRAIACLPALTGNLGVAGGGLGPRHGAQATGHGLGTIAFPSRLDPAARVPEQMERMTEALTDGRVRALLLFGTDMLSSFADAGRLEAALARLPLVVSHDLFWNDTARRCADLVLPGTAWLEELGCKGTNTHLYLTPPALEPPGEARSAPWVLRQLARRLGLGDDFWPWPSSHDGDVSGPLDQLLDHPATGHATSAALAAEGGVRALSISHVAYPDLRFDTPSGHVELVSARAAALGLPSLPVFTPPTAPAVAGGPSFPLALCSGRTLTHFHAFYDQGRALPSLAAADPAPRLWISPADAEARGIATGDAIRIASQRGEMAAHAEVTDRTPAGTVWMRDGWAGLNRLTSGEAVLPDAAVELFGFAAGQAAYDAWVEVERAAPGSS